MKNSKKIIIVFLVVVIIALVALVILFATNIIKLNNKNNNIDKMLEENINKDINELTSNDIYDNFLKQKTYLENFTVMNGLLVEKINYAYYDLDNNGIKELIVYISDDPDYPFSEFGTSLIYTYVNNEVTFIEEIYHFGNILYNIDDNTISYTATRTSVVSGNSYGYYKLNNNMFELVKEIKVVFENGEPIYYDIATNEKYDRSIENNIKFNFNELSY